MVPHGIAPVDLYQTAAMESAIRLLGDTQAAAFMTDQSGSILELNSRAGMFLGSRAEGAAGRPCHEVLQGSTASGEPICGRDCPYLASDVARSRPSPIDMMVARGGADLDGHRLEIAVHHVRIAVEDTTFVLHVLEDVRARRSRERIGTRLEGLLAGNRAAVWPLTGREVQVMSLIAQGLTSQDVARRLLIRPATARNYVSRVLDKLGAPNRAAAVVRFLTAARDPSTTGPEAPAATSLDTEAP